MSYITSFTSVWGTALQGVWVTWTASNLSPPATTISATAALTMDFDILLYGIDQKGIESENGVTPVKWPLAGPNNVKVYMLIQNPVDKNDSDAITTDADKPVYNDLVSYDGFLATLDYSDTTAANAADSNLKLTVQGTGGQTSFVDIVCTHATVNGKWDNTNCAKDTTRTSGTDTDWVPQSIDQATANLCTETWNINQYNTDNTGALVASATQRCVRIGFQLKRLMKTGDNATAARDATNTYDIDLGLRKYSITTGWRVPGGDDAGANTATVAPAAQDFAAINVDFHQFVEAPQTYSSALNGLSVASSALVVGVLALAF